MKATFIAISKQSNVGQDGYAYHLHHNGRVIADGWCRHDMPVEKLAYQMASHHGHPVAPVVWEDDVEALNRVEKLDAIRRQLEGLRDAYWHEWAKRSEVMSHMDDALASIEGLMMNNQTSQT